ncbi:MAG TPA: uracil-DNA glycosylase family protein [Thermoanaerobaculia bacterium]|nr:uracil-DNA glycosylase family protein [Thermoanaerobaculia bacterium]
MVHGWNQECFVPLLMPREIETAALAEAGIDRSQVYVTNVVKHFKWEPRGKRRIHKKPNALEIAACRPWLDAEIRVVKPRAIICLGSTAAQAVVGPKFKSRFSVEHSSIRRWPTSSRPRCTLRPSSAHPRMRRGGRKRGGSSRI